MFDMTQVCCHLRYLMSLCPFLIKMLIFKMYENYFVLIMLKKQQHSFILHPRYEGAQPHVA